MKSHYLSFLRYVLSFIGFMVGFTSKVLAQYGAPMNYFKINGNIKSEICNENLPGISIKIEDPSSDQVYHQVSDENGNFTLTAETEWNNKYLKFTYIDIDGTENHGEYLPQTLTYQLTRQNTINVSLPHSGRPPCYPDDPKLTIPTDTINKEKYEVKCPTKEISNEQPSDAKFFDAILFPNPNDGCFYLRFTIEFQSKVKMIIFNSSGQVVMNDEFNVTENKQEKKFNIEGLAPGCYILSLNDGRKTISKNFIVQKK